MQPAFEGPLPAMTGITESTATRQSRLVAQVAATSNRDAFRALFEHFAPRIKAVMIRSGAAHALADDLVQDVMMTVWRKAPLYHPDRGSVATWVYAIARNARTDRLRHRSSQPYVDVETLQIASDAPGGERGAMAAEETEDIAAALTSLPDDQRKIIELAFLQDQTQTAIAKQLGIPLGTVKSRMRLAYARLRECLGDHR